MTILNMSVITYIQHFIVTTGLTIYYNVLVLIGFAINFIKNPFVDPWAQKLRLEPPSLLTDPKFGIHKYIKVNNIKLHYVESGDPSKPLMIFLHGFPEFWYSWRHQIVEFNKNYWCIAVDMRGYGDSEKPKGTSSYTLDVLIEDLRDLIRQLGREKCILVSHDWGGLVACAFRDVYPDVLNAVVILASTSSEAWYHELWNNPDQRKKSWYVFMYQAPVIPEKFLLMNNLDVFDQIMLVPGKESVTKNDIECYKYWFGKPSALTPPINYYRANYKYYLPEKKRCEQNVPFLAAHGQKDAYLCYSLLEIMKEEYAHIETAIVENCAHFMQQEEPEKVNELIKDFLTKHGL